MLAKLDAHADLRIVEGRAASPILAYVEEHRPELLVVGTRGWTELTRVMLGSVAEHVVLSANVPVLVVRMAK